MAYRQYTEAEKARAVVEAEMTSVAAAAEKLDIPESTLRYWAKADKFAELRDKTRAEQAQGWSVLLSLAQERLAELIPTMDAKDAINLGGVATDKLQLLSGEATSRTESKTLTDDLSDDEKQRLHDWILGLPASGTGELAPG